MTVDTTFVCKKMEGIEKAKELQIKGNAAFQTGNYLTAITHYTSAIGHDPKNHLLYRQAPPPPKKMIVCLIVANVYDCCTAAIERLPTSH